MNLFALATYRSGAVATLGADADGWLEARGTLSAGLRQADGILLAYGVQEPSGPARTHHRAQVLWLADEVGPLGLQLWGVGGAPRHPSRWQRFTSREYPELPFSAALKRCLTPLTPQDWPPVVGRSSLQVR